MGAPSHSTVGKKSSKMAQSYQEAPAGRQQPELGEDSENLLGPSAVTLFNESGSVSMTMRRQHKANQKGQSGCDPDEDDRMEGQESNGDADGDD